MNHNPPSSNKLERLDTLRAFLALYVFFAHTAQGFVPPAIAPILRLAQEAVIGFFLLSGFVIFHSSYHKLHKGFRPYFAHRFLRIYSIVIPLFALLLLLKPLERASAGFASRLLGNLLMLQDFNLEKPNVLVAPVFGDSPLWSLSYEWWFYMLFYPIARWIPAGRQKHVVGMLGILAALSYLVYPFWLNRLFLYLPIWWLGAEAARLYREGREHLNLHRLLWPLIYLGATLLPILLKALRFHLDGGHLHFGLFPYLEPRHLAAALLLVLFAFSWRRLNWLGFHSLLSWSTPLSTVSFALYVAHFPLVTEAEYLQAIPAGFPRLLCSLLLLFAFCILTEGLLYPWLKRRWFNPTQN